MKSQMKSFKWVLVLALFSTSAMAAQTVTYRGVDDARVRKTCDLSITTDDQNRITAVEVVTQGFPAGIAFDAQPQTQEGCKVGYMGSTPNANQGVDLEFRAMLAPQNVQLTGVVLNYTAHGELSGYEISKTTNVHMPACIGGIQYRSLRNIVSCVGLRRL